MLNVYIIGTISKATINLIYKTGTLQATWTHKYYVYLVNFLVTGSQLAKPY